MKIQKENKLIKKDINNDNNKIYFIKLEDVKFFKTFWKLKNLEK